MSDVLKNLENNASDDVINKSKLKMNRVKNPPEYEDGMGTEDFDDFDFGGAGGDFGDFGGSSGTDDIFGQGGSTQSTNPFGGGSPFNSSIFGPQQPAQEPQKAPEDEFWDFMKTALKLGWGGTKKSFKYITSRTTSQWLKILSRSLWYEGGICALCILLLLFGVKNLLIIRVTSLLVLSIVSAGVSVIAFSFVADYVIKNGGDTHTTEQPTEEAFTDSYDEYDDEYEDEYEDDYEDETEGLSEASSIDFSDFTDMYEDSKKEALPNEGDLQQLIETIKNNRVNDRGTIFDMYTKLLPQYTPDFDNKEPITEENNPKLFHIINMYCTDAIHATTGRKIDEDDDTYLIEAFKTKFYILAKMKRIPGVNNLNAIAQEVASFFKVDYDDECFASVESLGNAYIIKIYTLENVLISLGDLMRHKDVIDEFKGNDMLLPTMLGVTDTGKPVIRDLAKLESMIVAGMPRSGKTWAVLSILTQLAMFNSPEDLQFIILDPKSTISDYRYFSLPHVLCWSGETREFLSLMRDLVDREYSARSDLMGKHSCVNIFEFREQHPEIKMPLIYLVLEEVVTYAESLTKEEKEEFDSVMLKLATTLPAAGIRMILVPHVAKHQFLNKTVKDVIPFRVSVKGSEEHIKGVLDIKNFPRTLLNKGDMAMKIDSEKACFIKSPVITDSPDGNKKIYNTISRIWDAQGYKLRVSPALMRLYEKGVENRVD